MTKILFLAQFAPTNGVLLNEPKNAEERFYEETYHREIIKSLERLQHELGFEFETDSDVQRLITDHDKFDLVWSLYNRIGFRNSEVFVQSLCEYLGVKYIGATPNIRALIEDKSMSKQLAEHIGVKTADWVVASKAYPLSGIQPFPGPYFVKPRFGSASIGIDESCVCNTWEAAITKSVDYFSKGLEIIVEKYIDGVYYGVPIINSMDGQPIIAVPHYQLSEKAGGVITYSQKRFAEDGMVRYISKDEHLNKMLIFAAKKYFLETQPCDYARIDFMVDNKSGIPLFLEVNALMNLGVHGGFVHSFLESGFGSYDDIVRSIVKLGLAKLESRK
jgi:D-alanine-D-alanine ligase